MATRRHGCSSGDVRLEDLVGNNGADTAADLE